MSIHTINLANGTLTRVGYVDVAVPPEAVGLSVADVAAVAWAAPQWADNQQVRVGAATWFADSGGRRFAFDPLQAADNVLRADRAAETMHQAAFANVLQQTGFARESVDALVMQGRVDTFTDGAELAAGLSAHVSGGHCPGHTMFRFGAGEREVSFVGHLAVSPLHLASGECAALNADPGAAWKLLREVAGRGRTLIGPLWPSPGFGRWNNGVFVAGE